METTENKSVICKLCNKTTLQPRGPGWVELNTKFNMKSAANASLMYAIVP